MNKEHPHQLSRADSAGIERVLDLLSPRWTTAILLVLSKGRIRTTEFLRALPRLSAKTLSERLKRLQDAGLVSRQVYAEVPPRVEYELTVSGVRMLNALDLLKTLAEPSE